MRYCATRYRFKNGIAWRPVALKYNTTTFDPHDFRHFHDSSILHDYSPLHDPSYTHDSAMEIATGIAPHDSAMKIATGIARDEMWCCCAAPQAPTRPTQRFF